MSMHPDTDAADGAGALFSVVIPTLNEAGRIEDCVRAVRGSGVQVIVVDGGSTDGTVAIAQAAGARVVQSQPGRATQMNQGAVAATAPIVLFLHADTKLPGDWHQLIDSALAAGSAWGRFDLRFDDPHPLLKVVAFAINGRSRLTGIATGDQAIFLSRGMWLRSQGYAAIALMEDIELSRRLKRLAGAPACLRSTVTTSARRWRRDGIVRTIFLMWWLRWRYFAGASPNDLYENYYGRRS